MAISPAIPASAKCDAPPACAHCDLPSPDALHDAAGRVFCCAGCRTVYAVIRESGLESYYRVKTRAEGDRRAARVSGRSYAEFDDAAFAHLHAQQRDDGLGAIELRVEGAHCAACVWLLERLPRVAPGVIESRFDLRRGLLRVIWDPSATTLSNVARAIDSLGYAPCPARGAQARELRRREDHKLLVRIGVAGALAGNVMLFAFALYGGEFAGIEPVYATFFRWTSAALGLLALAWPGSLFFRGAWAALRAGVAHLDLPIAIGLAAGAGAGLVNTIVGKPHIYFDSLTVLVFLLLVGRWIQRRQQRSATDAVELLYSVTPSVARRVEGADVREMPIEVIVPGDLLEVRAGDTLPVDGVIEAGGSTLNEALLSGESRPRSVETGDAVCAGAQNINAALRIRATATGEETRVGKLMRLVEQASREPAPIVRMADRIAGYFTVAMITLSALTLLLWQWLDPSRAIDNATALLIVTCPCALGLATPLVLTIAVGRAAKLGILVKGAETLERLARPGVIFLDKTGTITAGRVELLSWHGAEEAKPLVKALERSSAHPVANAVINAFRDVVDLLAEEVEQLPAGVAGRVNGRRVAMGTAEFIRSRNPKLPSWVEVRIEALLSDGLSPALVAVDDEVVAVAGFGDSPRPDAAISIAALRKMGWRVEVLSGDHPEIVRAVATSVGVPETAAHGAVTPERKLACVRQAATSEPVVMVGDGVNDAAALSAASVGIAVQGGAEASLAAAAVYLHRPGLASVVEVVRGGRRAIQLIRAGLTVSIVYNAVAALLAITGVISPLIAAILMPLSSFTVVSLALGGKTFEERPCP